MEFDGFQIEQAVIDEGVLLVRSRQTMQTAVQRKKEINLYGSESVESSFMWTDALRTGHDDIDRQHQAMYTTFRGVANLLDDPDTHVRYWLGMVVRATEEYVVTHFEDEEQLMATHGYPDYHAHKLLHIKIVEDLKSHQANIKRLTTKAEELTEARNLLRFLGEWLNQHILEEDTKFVALMRTTK
ncbi:MAG: hemerythrin family protein [Magnetococcales bacterium]|nr:hemerythrin family protein [Magnetococcales bacterium]MBF0583281.1 hemerythrin family protein [Magnetococcales bacterium]